MSGTEDKASSDLADMSAAYRGIPQDEPPPALDNMIRAAARREVKAHPQPVRSASWRQWTGPVAVAATVVLTVSIGLLSMDEKPDMVSSHMQSMMKPRAAVSAEKQVATAKEEMSSDAASAKAINEMPEPVAGKPTASPSAATRDVTQALPAMKKNRLSAPVVRAPSVAADAPSPESSQAAAELKALPPPVAESRAAIAGFRSQAAPAAEAESPDAWLQRILVLHKEGKTRESEAELAGFKRRYPDYPLPEELKHSR